MAAGAQMNTESNTLTNWSDGSVHHASSMTRGWSATWNTGVMPCSTNADHSASWSGCDSGRQSTKAGAIIARRTPVADSDASWPRNHRSSRSVRCATGDSTAPPSTTTDAHQRYQAAMFAVSAPRSVESGRLRNSTEQSHPGDVLAGEDRPCSGGGSPGRRPSIGDRRLAPVVRSGGASARLDHEKLVAVWVPEPEHRRHGLSEFHSTDADPGGRPGARDHVIDIDTQAAHS